MSIWKTCSLHVLVPMSSTKMMLQAEHSLFEHSTHCGSTLRHGFGVCEGTGACKHHLCSPASIYLRFTVGYPHLSHAGHCNLVEDDFVDYKGILQGKTLHGIRPSHAGLCHRHCSSVFHARNVPADMNLGAHRSVVLTKDAPVLPCTYPHHVRKKWDVGIGFACGDVT